MAFPEDTDYTAPRVQSSQGSSVMQLKSSTLFALILQFGAGLLAVMYALPAFIAVISFFPVFVEITPLMSIYGYLIVWAILPIVGVFQIWTGYRLYKKIPDMVGRAMKINILAIILFGIDTVISAYEGNLLAYPEVVTYLAANIILVILLSIQTVQDELDHRDHIQSDYQVYSG